MPLPDDPTPAILSRLNQNIMTLGCATEEMQQRRDVLGTLMVRTHAARGEFSLLALM
jgi:hypothetical protein